MKEARSIRAKASETAAVPRLSPPTRAFWLRFAAARPRLLLLDYDGRLAPHQVDRMRARPGPGVLPALRRILAAGTAEIVILTGRPVGDVDALLGQLDVEVYGGHGWEHRPRGASSNGGPSSRGRCARSPRRRPGRRRRGSASGRAPASSGSTPASPFTRAGESGLAVFLGDAITDEVAFRAIARRGVGILVRGHDRPTAASFRLAGTSDVVGFLDRVAAIDEVRAAPSGARRAKRARGKSRLVVVSNRLPRLAAPEAADGKDGPSVGGLVSALGAALERAPRSLWFGWSGRSVSNRDPRRVFRESAGRIETLGMDLRESDLNGYYYGFCNRTLWPLFHLFPERVITDRAQFACYQRVNSAFARTLARVRARTATWWVEAFERDLAGG